MGPHLLLDDHPLLLDDRSVACVTLDDLLLMRIAADGHCLMRYGTTLRVGHIPVPRHHHTRILIPRTPLGASSLGRVLRNRGLARLRGLRLLPGLARLLVLMEGNLIDAHHYVVVRIYIRTIGSLLQYHAFVSACVHWLAHCRDGQTSTEMCVCKFNCPIRWHTSNIFLAAMVPQELQCFIRRLVPLVFSIIVLNFGVRHRYRDLLTMWPRDRDIDVHHLLTTS